MILSEHEAKELLERSGVAVIPTKAVRSFEDASSKARAMGYPVVLKYSSPLHTHKTEIGGVCLNLRDERELEQALHKLERLREQLDANGTIIVEPMAPEQAELFIGVQRHPQFGALITLGLGGIWLELMRDVTFRLLPASRADFEEMIAELRSWPKLEKGFRHLPPVAKDHLIDLLVQVSRLSLDHPQIEELDLNPILAGPTGAVVLDATIVMEG